MNKRYRIIFKQGEDLPWYEPIDPSFKAREFTEAYFKLFFTNGYIDRCKIEAAHRQYEAEQQDDSFPYPSLSSMPPRYQRQYRQMLGKRSLAFRQFHLEGVCI